MRKISFHNTQRIAGPSLTLIATLLFALLSGCNKDDEPIDPYAPSQYIPASENFVIPSEVELPANSPGGNTRVATYFAEGYQIYRAQLVPGTQDTYEWVFVAPIADLYNEQNQKVGVHFAGPSWQLTSDDSRINAQAFNPPKTKNIDTNSIDWLLLMPKDGTIPSGTFQGVDYVQRIATVGGIKPAAPNGLVGEIAVPYKAIYRFSKIN